MLGIADDGRWQIIDYQGNLQSKNWDETMKILHDRIDMVQWTSFEHDGYVHAVTTAVATEVRKTKSGNRVRRIEMRNPGSKPTTRAEGPILAGSQLVEALLRIKATNKMSDERISNL